MSISISKYFMSNKFNSFYINLVLSVVFGLGFTLISCGSDVDMYKAEVNADDFGEADATVNTDENGNKNKNKDKDEDQNNENSLDSIKNNINNKSWWSRNGESYLDSIEDFLDKLNNEYSEDNDNSDNNINNNKKNKNNEELYSDNDENNENNGNDGDSDNNNPNVISFNGYKCYSADMNICEIEYTIFKKTNEYRVSRGLSALSSNMVLSYTARDWSKSQSRNGYISHSGFPSSRERVISSLKSDSSLDGSSLGSVSAENVAATGYSYSTNAAIGEAFVEMWINSAGHRANIVGSHKFLGVGVVKSSSGSYSYYATQIFAR